MPTFQDLFDQLQSLGETQTLDAKAGSEIGRSVLETVCAYANEPGLGGGYLLLGVAEEKNLLGNDYRVVGVDNPDKLQNDLVTQCGSSKFNVPIRPEISVETYGDKRILVVYIPESVPSDKPVYIKDLGLPRGAFRRVGASDVHCTDADIEIFYQNRSGKPYEDTILESVNVNADISLDAVKAYRRRRAAISQNAPELTWSTTELLHSLRAVILAGKDISATVCGLLSFGKESALRREMPMARVDYIRINGRRWVPTSEVRFQTVEMRGPLLMLIPRVISTIMDDIPVSAVFEPNTVYRKDVPLIPEQVIREAVVNALMHRNYRTRQQMEKANLTMPLFESDRHKDSFAVTLFTHHFMDEQDLKWLANFKDCELSEDEARTLLLLRELGQIDNESYRLTHQLDTLAASSHLRKLRDHGLLEQQGKGNKTYYIPGKRFLDSLPNNDDKTDANTQAPIAQMPLVPKLDTLPTDLRQRIQELGQRASPTILDDLVEDLCRWQALNRNQLSSLIGKGPDNIRKCLRRMLNAKRLAMLNPDQPSHPDQKYVAVERREL